VRTVGDFLRKVNEYAWGIKKIEDWELGFGYRGSISFGEFETDFRSADEYRTRFKYSSSGVDLHTKLEKELEKAILELENQRSSKYKIERQGIKIAKVKIYIKKKDKPENQQRIKEIIQEITHQEAKIQEYDNQMVEVQKARESVIELKEIYELNKKNKEEQIKKAKDEITRAEREKAELTLKNQKEVQKKEAAQAYLADKKEFLATVSNLIGHGIVKESNLSKSFQENYAAYKHITKPGYLSTILEDVPKYLTCPITDELFQDPVVTECGHTFSSAALLKWLSKEKTCPKCRKHITDFQRNLSIQDAIDELLSKRLQEQERQLKESKLS
jgi:adenosyl cobinamide kinase/adenosyl cobinamide phosphate guanylyltransferase